VWEGQADASTLFPQGAGSMLLTSIFLAIVPVVLFPLALLEWFVRRSRVENCLDDLCKRHEVLCADLIRAKTLTVRVNKPRLDACWALLNPGGESDARDDEVAFPPCRHPTRSSQFGIDHA
jgi:hypothetical protein